MTEMKYMDRVVAWERVAKLNGGEVLSPFDLEALKPKNPLKRLVARIFRALFPFLAWIVRKIPTIVKLFGFYWVTRVRDVADVLARDQDFEVPFGPEMRVLAGGADFVLGVNDPAAHGRARKWITTALLGETTVFAMKQDLRVLSSEFGRGLLENGDGRIDVMRDYFLRATTEVCFRHFGLRAPDAYAFADWSLAVSNLLFADPKGQKLSQDLARNGAARLCAVIDNAIQRSLQNPGLTRADYTKANDRSGEGVTPSIIDKLVRQSHEPGGPTLEDIQSIVLGLITGFIPTIGLSLGNAWEEILARPEIMAKIKSEAAADNWEGVEALIGQMCALRPALSPGQFRFCPRDTQIGARKIPAGAALLVSTAAAMRDPSYAALQSSGKLDFVFGHGVHACMGKHQALAVMSGLISTLASQTDLKPAKGKAGKLVRLAAFPYRLDMEYKSPNAPETMFLIVVPVTTKTSKHELDCLIAHLEHPAKPEVKAALDKTGVVHFTSIVVIEDDGHRKQNKPLNDRYVCIELTTDGEPEIAIPKILAVCQDYFLPILAAAGFDPEGQETLTDYLLQRVVRLHSWPWGATGLDFNGLPGTSVARIERELKIAEYSRRIIEDHLSRYLGQGDRPMRILTIVRRVFAQDHYLKLMRTQRRNLHQIMAEIADERLDTLVPMPSRRGVPLTTFNQPTKLDSMKAFLLSYLGLPLTIPICAALAASLFGAWKIVNPFYELPSDLAQWPLIAGKLLTFIGVVLLNGGIIVGIPALIFYLLFRASEKTDRPDLTTTPDEKLTSFLKNENLPNFRHNHFLAVGTLKPGVIRVLTHAFALWAIKAISMFFYRPGFVLSMGTIQYARWWRLPGTRKVAFYGNYDGSWDNYLEDFVARARWGQTGVWSNWIGFPKTNQLVFEGARDADRFKRWVRTQQQVVPFWYSRYPQLTTDQIRRNSLIHAGLDRADTEAESEQWLALFGSAPKSTNTIETNQVQSLMFNGQSAFDYCAYLYIDLPIERGALKTWHKIVTGSNTEVSKSGIAPDLIQRGGARIKGDKFHLQPCHAVCFGDVSSSLASLKSDIGSQPKAAATACYLALTQKGLMKYKASGKKSTELALEKLIASFPFAFRSGMSQRANILGDFDKDSPENWRWSDQQLCGVMIVYGQTKEDRDAIADLHIAILEKMNGKLVHRTDSQPATKGSDYEHFGFKDGISQPVMRGTRRHAKGVAVGDEVAPGEFLFGYPNNQGYLPPSPVVVGQVDIGDILPEAKVPPDTRFPNFTQVDQNEWLKDFGRNGTFLVVRELAQDVDGFNDAMQAQAALINRSASEYATSDELVTRQYRGVDRVVGRRIDPDWVSAKLMGRWQDGAPLVGNPTGPSKEDLESDARPTNDFSYGDQDSQGLACPFGAHIRRANPRDSRQPGDGKEQQIMNRHRIIRRGRTYSKAVDRNETELGLSFVCLCTDIERQFEFVQQTWLNSPGFHGLDSEPDPIAGCDNGLRTFSIPTSAGPISLRGLEKYVTAKAGGYFFMPSRAALYFLESILG